MEQQRVPDQNARRIATEVDFSHIWETLQASKWQILGLTALVSMLATLIVFSLTPVYRASATLLIEPKKNNIVSAEELFGLDTSRGEYLSTQFALLESMELLKTVAQRLNLEETSEFKPKEPKFTLGTLMKYAKESELFESLPFLKPSDLKTTAPAVNPNELDRISKQLKRMIIISPIPKTQLVRVHVDSTNPILGTQIANELTTSYINSQLDAKLSMRETATSWMAERLIELKNKLQASEAKLQSYREEENLVDLGGVTTLSADTLSSLSSRLTDARRDLAQAESQYRQVEKINRNNLDRLSSLPVVLSNPLIQQFKGNHAKAASKVEELSRRYGPKHPKMIAAQSELASAKESLRLQVGQVVASIEKNYQLAKANEAALTRSYEANKDEIQSISRKEFKLRELQLEVDTNRSLYNTFLGRLKETSATTELETTNARVVDPATTPTEPIKPKKGLLIALSAMLTLIGASALTLLSDALGGTYTNTSEVEQNLNLPVMGRIPLVKRKSRKQLSNLFANTPTGIFSESIRSLRTSALLNSKIQDSLVIAVTSSVPGEGKSIIGSNLAHALSQLKPTVFVEADLRQPVLTKSYELPVGAPGVANLLSGNATLEECLHEKEGLSIIPAGQTPPNPLELLSSPRFAKLLEVLRKKYAYIVLDTPPVQAVSDPLVVATHADSLLMTVKADDTSRKIVQDSIGQILQSNLRISGVVLSHVAGKHIKYYRYRDYHG